ncbi:hypothetical protein DFP73DRAFT_586131 [Morchella snyderi]|nr:hypothetical protein DFP73DRAFT_586131 [Morchella snyderi]
MAVSDDEAPLPAPFHTTPGCSDGEDGWRWERFTPEMVMEMESRMQVEADERQVRERQAQQRTPPQQEKGARRSQRQRQHTLPSPPPPPPPPPPPGKRKFSKVQSSPPPARSSSSSSSSSRNRDANGNVSKKRLSFAAVPSVYGRAAKKKAAAAAAMATATATPVVYAGAACVSPPAESPAARFRAVKTVRSVPVAADGGGGGGGGVDGMDGIGTDVAAGAGGREEAPQPQPQQTPEQDQDKEGKVHAPPPPAASPPPPPPPPAAATMDGTPHTPPPPPPPPATTPAVDKESLPPPPPAAASLSASLLNENLPSSPLLATLGAAAVDANTTTDMNMNMTTNTDVNMAKNVNIAKNTGADPVPNPDHMDIDAPFTPPPHPSHPHTPFMPPPPPPTLSNSPYSTSALVCQSTPLARQTFGLPYSERAAIAAAIAATTATTTTTTTSPAPFSAITTTTTLTAAGYGPLRPYPYSPAQKSAPALLRAALKAGVAPGAVAAVAPRAVRGGGDITLDAAGGGGGGRAAAVQAQAQVEVVDLTDSPPPVDVDVDVDVDMDMDMDVGVMRQDDAVPPVVANADGSAVGVGAVGGDGDVVLADAGADAMCDGEPPVGVPELVDHADLVNPPDAAIPPPARTVAPSPSDPDTLYAHDDFPPENPFPSPAAASKTPQPTINGQPVCTLHRSATCDAESCVHEFFSKYCPLDDVATTTAATAAAVVYTDHAYAPQTRTQAGAAAAQEEAVLHAPVGRKELLAVMIAAGALAGYRRLPYLTAEAREFLRWHAQSVLAELKKVDGDLLHVQFTVREIITLIPAVRAYALQSKIRLPNFSPSPTPTPAQLVQDLYSLLTYTFSHDNDTKALINRFLTTTNFSLPGRQPSDIHHFIWDAYNNIPNLRDPAIMVAVTRLPPLRSRNRRPESAIGNSRLRALRRELGVGADLDPLRDMQARHNWAVARLRPVWTFNGGSSDIHDAQWAPGGGGRFAMSTLCTSDEYNRPGNLMLGSSGAGAGGAPPSVRMLYRHALRVRPTGGVSERYEYTSVSSIRFSNDGRMLHSCGLDGRVKTWSAADGKWLGEVAFNDQVVVMESSAAVDGLLAAGRSNGAVAVIQVSGSGAHESVRNLNLFDRLNKNKVYPAAMAWGAAAGFENVLVVGYDNEAGANSKFGGLAVWDVERGVNLFKYYGHIKYPQRHFDVRMGQRGRFVTGSLRPGKADGSIVRLWDLNTMSEVLECVSDQSDLNCVSISPCERYLTSSDTTNNTLLWDIRNASRPLHSLQHGATTMPTSAQTNLAEDDTGVTFITWSAHSSTLFTGGSDGKIKQWDPARAQPFLVDVAAVESQIMTAAFSPDWDALIVGEASGRATLFAVGGDEEEGARGVPVPVPEIVTDWSEDRGLMNPDGDESMRWSSWNGQRAGAGAVVAAAAAQGEEEEEESGVLLGREMVAEGMIARDPRNPRYVWATERYSAMKEKERRREKAGRGGRGGGGGGGRA